MLSIFWQNLHYLHTMENFELPDFDFDFTGFSDISFSTEENRIIKPPKTKPAPVMYEYAKQLALDLPISKDCNYFAIVSGNFILGDLFEALAIEQQFQYTRLDISTLSLSEDNIDSLKNLLMFNYCQNLNLIVSDYFYSHERNNLIRYIYQELDIDNRFQLAVAGTHTKITSFTTHNGLKVVIHGSGNLRSSRSVEQISITESEILYNFVTEFNNSILEKYATIRKGIRASKLWEVVNHGNKIRK